MLQPLISQLCPLGCDQLVVGPTHSRGGTFNLLMADVPDRLRVAVVAPLGNADRFLMSAVISTVIITNMFVIRKVFLKRQVNWNTVCGATQDLPWPNICLADNPVKVLN